MGKKKTKTKHVFVIAVLSFLLAGHLFALRLAFEDPHTTISQIEKEMPFQIISINEQLISPLSSLIISDTTPIVKGQANTGSLIVVTIYGAQQYLVHTTTANQQGTWMIPIISPLLTGSYTLYAQGNTFQTQMTTFSIKEKSETIHFEPQNKFLHVTISQNALFASDILEFTSQTQEFDNALQSLQVSILNQQQDLIFSETLDFQETQQLSIALPHSIPVGSYLLHVSTTQNDQYFSSTAPFTISDADALTRLSLLLSTQTIFPIALTLLFSNLLLIMIFLIKELGQLTGHKGRA